MHELEHGCTLRLSYVHYPSFELQFKLLAREETSSIITCFVIIDSLQVKTLEVHQLVFLLLVLEDGQDPEEHITKENKLRHELLVDIRVDVLGCLQSGSLFFVQLELFFVLQFFR